MKEEIKSMIQSIESGNTVQAEKHFMSVLASKVTDQLSAMKVEVGMNMFKPQSATIETDTPKEE